MSAKNGASGKAATNSVTKPYWMTAMDRKRPFRTQLTPPETHKRPECIKSGSILTHFQVLVEQGHSPGILQVVVLLPRHVLVRCILGHGTVLPLPPPVVHFPIEKHPRDKLIGSTR